MLALTANDVDKPNFNQAMNDPDTEGCQDVMDKEIIELVKKNAWTPVDIREGQKIRE